MTDHPDWREICDRHPLPPIIERFEARGVTRNPYEDKPGMFASWGEVFTHPAVILALAVAGAVLIYALWVFTK